jgi:hypothetical protein
MKTTDLREEQSVDLRRNGVREQASERRYRSLQAAKSKTNKTPPRLRALFFQREREEETPARFQNLIPTQNDSSVNFLLFSFFFGGGVGGNNT